MSNFRTRSATPSEIFRAFGVGEKVWFTVNDDLKRGTLTNEGNVPVVAVGDASYPVGAEVRTLDRDPTRSYLGTLVSVLPAVQDASVTTTE